MRNWLKQWRKSLIYIGLSSSRRLWQSRAFWTRALLCWAIGIAIIINDDLSSYDLRLQIRGPKPASPNIVLLDVSEREWSAINPEARNVLRPLKELVSLNDSYFWNLQIWQKFMTSLLASNPKSVGVVFFFGENVRVASSERDELNKSDLPFYNPKVIWGADVDSAGRMLVPFFAANYNVNVGLRGLRSDDDGTVRRFSSSMVQIPHFAVRLAQISVPEAAFDTSIYNQPEIINYAGGAPMFHVVNFADVMAGRIPPSAFSGKIVLIGSLQNPLEIMQTPLGKMSRTEILANVVDNVIRHRTIASLQKWIYCLLLALLMLAAIWVLGTYPQSASLVIFIMLGAVWSALSAWAFDSLKLWIPVLAPLVQLTLTYIVFLSYRLALNEQRTWRLQQESMYHKEIEQLKNNFVSMMSHDLKTPIAKIQAICDRLLATIKETNVVSDLKSLRRSSDDLHRYIQSILQVTKVEAKDFKINKEVTDINENIEQVISRLQPLAQEKAIDLKIELEPMFSIEADTTLLQEVIHNLIENAIKYTPTGGAVKVTSEEKDDKVVVTVADTGPGIAAEEQAQIWGKFIRGQNQMESKGSGLGLFLVKYFIELHGGRVFLNSQLGIGTKIGFALPVVSESPPGNPG